MCNDNRMIMKTKNVLLGMAAVCGCAFQAIACTGIALTAADGSYVQSRTIEWARGVLQSEYVVIPRGQRLRSLLLPELMAWFSHPNTAWWDWPSCRKSSSPKESRSGTVGRTFLLPQYGGYEQYDPAQSDRTLADLQLVAWILTQFSTIDQVKAAIASVRVVGLEPSSVVHWRIGEPSGRRWCWKSSAGCRISTRTKSAYSPMPPVSSGSSPI